MSLGVLDDPLTAQAVRQVLQSVLQLHSAGIDIHSNTSMLVSMTQRTPASEQLLGIPAT